MTGWELFWFAVASWFIGSGMGKLGRESAKRIRAWRDMRRLAAIRFDDDSRMVHQVCKGYTISGAEDRPRIMVGKSGGMAIGGKPGTEECIAIEINGSTLFATLTAEIHTIIVPCDDGEVLVFKRTTECIPNGDRLAVVFR